MSLGSGGGRTKNNKKASEKPARAGEENMANKDNKKKPNPTDTHVGSRIRLRRNMLGMSQEKLGENLGITFQQIQKYEKGANRVAAGRLVEIARVLNCSVEDILGADVKTHSNGPTPSQLLTEPYTHQLVNEFQKISKPSMRRMIVNLVKEIAER